MTRAQQTTPLGELAAAILTDNAELRARVHRLIEALVASAEYTVRYGTPTERAQLMRTVVPSLLKSIQAADTGSGDDAQAAAYQRLLSAMGGEPPHTPLT